jgi:predicted nucleic acid-binding Zn finger protein
MAQDELISVLCHCSSFFFVLFTKADGECDGSTQDFKAAQESNRFQGVDLPYQIARLRLARAMTDGEVELMMRVLQQNTGTYEQVVEVSS